MATYYYQPDGSVYTGMEAHQSAYYTQEHLIPGPSDHMAMMSHGQVQHEYQEAYIPLPANTHPSGPQPIPQDMPRPTVSAHRRHGSLSSSQGRCSEDDSSPHIAGTDALNTPPHADSEAQRTCDPNFPTPQEFENLVHEYLSALSPKKRDKALLTQKMYDNIMVVLQDPKSTDTKTAQFRFWAKKMFTLTTFGGEHVICHDNKPVAVKEQIFEVLVHCHQQALHGGRDKTSAQVRKFYSWIPKEIIARFVRDCPFCKAKRTHTSESVGPISEAQARILSLQHTGDKRKGEEKVSLARAKAELYATGYKPYSKPSRVEQPTGRVHMVGGTDRSSVSYLNGMIMNTVAYEQYVGSSSMGISGSQPNFQTLPYQPCAPGSTAMVQCNSNGSTSSLVSMGAQGANEYVHNHLTTAMHPGMRRVSSFQAGSHSGSHESMLRRASESAAQPPQSAYAPFSAYPAPQMTYQPTGLGIYQDYNPSHLVPQVDAQHAAGSFGTHSTERAMSHDSSGPINHEDSLQDIREQCREIAQIKPEDMVSDTSHQSPKSSLPGGGPADGGDGYNTYQSFASPVSDHAAFPNALRNEHVDPFSGLHDDTLGLDETYNHADPDTSGHFSEVSLPEISDAAQFAPYTTQNADFAISGTSDFAHMQEQQPSIFDNEHPFDQGSGFCEQSSISHADMQALFMAHAQNWSGDGPEPTFGALAACEAADHSQLSDQRDNSTQDFDHADVFGFSNAAATGQ